MSADAEDSSRYYEAGHGGRGCPYCNVPPIEHETEPGHLYWTWICPNRPGWRGVFLDRPVTGLKPNRWRT